MDNATYCQEELRPSYIFAGASFFLRQRVLCTVLRKRVLFVRLRVVPALNDLRPSACAKIRGWPFPLRRHLR
jgi:hypothetical protein